MSLRTGLLALWLAAAPALFATDAVFAPATDRSQQLDTPRIQQQENREQRDGGSGPAEAEPLDVVEYQDVDDREGTTGGKGNTYTGPPTNSGSREVRFYCDLGFEQGSFEGEDSWYSFFLEMPAVIRLSTCFTQTEYNTSLAVLDEQLVTMAVNDDSPTGLCELPFASELECNLQPGFYYVVVDGAFGDGGFYHLQAELDFPLDVPPAQVQIHHVGGDTLRVHWQPVPHALGYRLFGMGQYMPFPQLLAETLQPDVLLTPPFTVPFDGDSKVWRMQVHTVGTPDPGMFPTE